MNHRSNKLAALRERFNTQAGLITGLVYKAGYHSRLPILTPAHPYRENAVHAHAFLSSEDSADQELGRSLLSRVLAAQETDPASPWYGIWSWFAEEPPSAMKPADWNWADFIGSTLLAILHQVPDRLGHELLEATRASLGHAAWSIFRRNVAPSYTNIAIIGTAVTLGAGLALNEPRLIDYGRARFRRLRASIEAHGVQEYNSPIYYQVDIAELEGILALPLDADLRAEAEYLLEIFWGQIARHFHPPTAQWAGPHSRSYTNWLDRNARAFLQERLGFDLPPAQDQGGPSTAQPTPLDDPYGIPAGPVPCPEKWRSAFQQIPSSPHEQIEVWTRDTQGQPRIVSTTWSDSTVTLGSVNCEVFWKQCQPVVGYWRGQNGDLGRVRVCVLLNGDDFCSAQLRSTQRGAVILGAVQFLAGEGTYHVHFDKPADGTFAVRDLRLRFEVEGEAPAVRSVSPAEWTLCASGEELQLLTDAVWFDGQTVSRWQTGEDGRCAWLDAVFYEGAEVPFHPGTVARTGTAFALAWKKAAPQVLGPLQVSDGGQSLSLAGLDPELTLSVPHPPSKLPY
jgi:hypothetical protein